MEETSIFVQEEIEVQKENLILIQEDNEHILGFDEIGDEKKLIMDESSYKSPKLDFTSLDPHIKETMEVQTQAQIRDVLETQVQVQQVEGMKVLSLEEKSLLSSSIIPLSNEL